MKAEKGFTLLEVMIALAVFATLSAAVTSASQFVLGQSARVEARLLAAWLADNHLTELKLQHAPLGVGSQRFETRYAQRDWTLTRKVEPGTGSGFLRVELSVSPAGSDQVLETVTQWVAIHHD